MNIYGWIIFLISNIVVITLITFCFYQVLTIPQEHMHSPLNIDTHDLEDEDEDSDDDEKLLI
jgi:hypothetical protein